MTGAVVLAEALGAEVINLMSLKLTATTNQGLVGHPYLSAAKWGLAAAGTQGKDAFTRSPNSVELYCAGGSGNSQAHRFFRFF